jgi:hypothetical protein
MATSTPIGIQTPCKCANAMKVTSVQIARKVPCSCIRLNHAFLCDFLNTKLVMCPKDDDPLTINQNYRAVNILISATRDLEGLVGVTLHSTTVYIPMVNFSNSDCSSAVSFKGKFGQVQCTLTYLNSRQRSMDLVFQSWPIQPKDNNLYTHYGNPPLKDFSCDVKFSSIKTICEFSDLVNFNIRGRTTLKYLFNLSAMNSCLFVFRVCLLF